MKIIHGSLDKCWDELVELNRKGAGIFVTVNETDRVGRKNCNIVRARAIFQDDDDGFEGTYPLPPSIEVETSPGKYQRYWLSSGLTPIRFDILLDRLVAAYGSDKRATDRARVFRLPGFLHLKDPTHPHLVTLLEPSPGTVYGAEELISAFLGYDKESSGDVERFDVGDVEGKLVRHFRRNALLFRVRAKRSVSYRRSRLFHRGLSMNGACGVTSGWRSIRVVCRTRARSLMNGMGSEKCGRLRRLSRSACRG